MIIIILECYLFLSSTFFLYLFLDTQLDYAEKRKSKQNPHHRSGPIIIGQACEFDYSGSQALRSLREDGIETVLINSNPATIMTDPSMADHVYLKPLTTKSLNEILAEHKDIDAVLPTMGGQTALNLCIEADEKGFGKITMWK